MPTIIRTAVFAVSLLLLIPALSRAQISLTAENVGLGGGGTAYLTGYEALFVNPANLYIQEKNYNLQIALLQGGASFDTPLPFLNAGDRFNHYYDSLLPYRSSQENRVLGEGVMDDFMDRNFPGNRRINRMQSHTDLYWFGIKWSGSERSYAMALRSRINSVYENGRGIYSLQPIERGNELLLDRSFYHHYQTLHELSFGYSESVSFLNGLIPRLSEFIIGIAPKIVVAGPYLNSEFTNRYRSADNGQTWIHEQGFREHSTSYFTTGQSFRTGTLNNRDLTDYKFGDLLRPSGIGAGLDIGITYLITFGSDLSVLRREDMPTEKSLRFSLSITDLGMIHHFRDSETREIDYREESAELPQSTTGVYFQGAPGEHLYFLSELEESPFDMVNQVSSGSFEQILPTAIHAGALFQINRLKVMGDVSYQLTRSRYATNLPAAYIGAELRPLSFLPLRAGTRFAANETGFYSFGGGLETRFFDISAGIQLKSSNVGPTTELLGASMVGVKFYIP